VIHRRNALCNKVKVKINKKRFSLFSFYDLRKLQPEAFNYNAIELGDRDRHLSYRPFIHNTFLFYGSIRHNLAFRLLTPLSLRPFWAFPFSFWLTVPQSSAWASIEPYGKGRGRGGGCKHGSTGLDLPGLASKRHFAWKQPSTPSLWVAAAKAENPYSAQPADNQKALQRRGTRKRNSQLGCGLERSKLSVSIAPHLCRAHFWCLLSRSARSMPYIIFPPSWRPLRFAYCVF
jgi:hypothetical protein